MSLGTEYWRTSAPTHDEQSQYCTVLRRTRPTIYQDSRTTSIRCRLIRKRGYPEVVLLTCSSTKSCSLKKARVVYEGGIELRKGCQADMTPFCNSERRMTASICRAEEVRLLSLRKNSTATAELVWQSHFVQRRLDWFLVIWHPLKTDWPAATTCHSTPDCICMHRSCGFLSYLVQLCSQQLRFGIPKLELKYCRIQHQAQDACSYQHELCGIPRHLSGLLAALQVLYQAWCERQHCGSAAELVQAPQQGLHLQVYHITVWRTWKQDQEAHCWGSSSKAEALIVSGGFFITQTMNASEVRPSWSYASIVQPCTV